MSERGEEDGRRGERVDCIGKGNRRTDVSEGEKLGNRRYSGETVWKLRCRKEETEEDKETGKNRE